MSNTSKFLLAFYRQWLQDADNALQDEDYIGVLHVERFGLCVLIDVYYDSCAQVNCSRDDVHKAMTDEFIVQHGEASYPFNRSSGQHSGEGIREERHMNEARYAFVKSQIQKLKAQQ